MDCKQLKNTQVKKAVLLCLCLSTANAKAAFFTGLGYVLDTDQYSTAWSVSADGSTAVGFSNGTLRTEAFRWTATDGIMGLGDFPGDAGIPSYSTRSDAFDTSADGRTVVGSGSDDSGVYAYRWTEADGMASLGTIGDVAAGSFALGVSADGNTVVGLSGSANGDEAFRWTETDGMVGIGDLDGGIFLSTAHAVSADGNIVVGVSESANGTEAFRWTETDGMVGLGDLAGGDFFSLATGISADGNTVVGFSKSANGGEAFLWTESDGMVGLGDLAGGSFNSKAFDASADGSVIVGSGSDASGKEALIWDDTNGMQNLEDVLLLAGVDLTGWDLKEALGISDDGLTIVGYGLNNGRNEAFLASLAPSPVPIPATAWLFASAFGVFGYLAKRKANG